MSSIYQTTSDVPIPLFVLKRCSRVDPFRRELELLYRQTGFVVEATYGDYRFRTPRPSPRALVLVRPEASGGRLIEAADRRLHPPHRVIRRVDEWLLNGPAEQPRAVLPEPDFSKDPVVCTPDGLRSMSVLHAMRAGCGPRARSRPGAQPPNREAWK